MSQAPALVDFPATTPRSRVPRPRARGHLCPAPGPGLCACPQDPFHPRAAPHPRDQRRGNKCSPRCPTARSFTLSCLVQVLRPVPASLKAPSGPDASVSPSLRLHPRLSSWVSGNQRCHLPRARARSSGRELAPLPGLAPAINAAAGPGSPQTSLPPSPAPPSRASGARRGAWKRVLEPAGNETTPQAGTQATGRRANTRGRRPSGSANMSGRRDPPIYPRSFFTHPPQRGAALDRGGLHADPTQVTPHPHPHSGTLSGCPRASSPAPPAGSHLTVHFRAPGESRRWGGNRESARGGVEVPTALGEASSKLLEPTGRESETCACFGIPASLSSADCSCLGGTRANLHCG